MVIELLKSVFSKIHILLDIWISYSLLGLCGIIVYFINNKEGYKSFLFSILKLASQYTSVNIADGIAAILTKFNISNKIGYFILDNISNNNTYMQALGKELGFN